MNLDSNALNALARSTEQLQNGFAHLPAVDEKIDWQLITSVLSDTATRLHNNYPYHHPHYMGQMLKPPHPVAHLAYTLAMNINPNNHALDGGRESSIMEKEAVAAIAAMFGWTEHLGHLCGGGTMANFEALWVARQLAVDAKKNAVLASSQSHYTHSRLSAVLAVPFRSVEVDNQGAMNLEQLEKELSAGDVGTVVATLGTTLAGSIDPLPEIIELQKKYGFRIHVDTAYGGYFTLAQNLDPKTRMAFDAIAQADSIVIDPHKHGLQPYGCGCILFKDPDVGHVYQHDSPYTYFSSDELHLGEISLECSRPGAAAVALWATQQALPMTRTGEFAQGMYNCRQGALTFYQWLHDRADFTPLFGPQLDIVCWASEAETASETSVRSKRLFDLCADLDLHLAVASVPKKMCVSLQTIQHWDQDHVDVLRACVMKPSHLDELPAITEKLSQAMEQYKTLSSADN